MKDAKNELLLQSILETRYAVPRLSNVDKFGTIKIKYSSAIADQKFSDYLRSQNKRNL